MTKLKNYLFLLLCLKIGQRQPQIFSPKVTNICEADVQWKLNFCSETIEATSPALKIIECCKYTAQIFPKLSSDEFCAKFSAFRVTAVTNVGPTCWDQPQPRLHQTFICNSLHNGIVVKPTRNSDSILISTVSSSSHQGSHVPSGHLPILFTELCWIKHCVYVTRHISATLRDIRDTQTVSRDTETPPACVGSCPHLLRSIVYIILQIGCKM